MMRFAAVLVLAGLLVSSYTHTSESEHVPLYKWLFIAALGISSQLCPAQAYKINASPGTIHDCLDKAGQGHFAAQSGISDELAYSDVYRGGEDFIALRVLDGKIKNSINDYIRSESNSADFVEPNKPMILQCIFKDNREVLAAMDMVLDKDQRSCVSERYWRQPCTRNNG